MPGTLYVVATPIGNLEDITLRALRVLKEVDLIACEDTRQTRKLLTRYDIATPMISYHEHNEEQRSPELVEKLKAGSDIALVSDAGAPTICDPGAILIRYALAEGILVVPIPGPSAVVTALMASGSLTERFLFVGFLPANRTARRRELDPLRSLPSMLIFYEAPHRLQAAIQDMLDVLGDRPAVLARELTKIHEEFRRASLGQLLDQLKQQPVKGEIVLIVAGASKADVQAQRTLASQEPDLYDAIVELMRTGNFDLKTAVKQMARARGMGRNAVYKEYLRQRAEREP